MKINANFNQRVVVHSAQSEWIESPMKGVYRRPLDRIGAEIARATTIVKYAPNSQFSPHVHTGGEEFLILEGVFQDEHGDYPAGCYIRNPPASNHTPSSEVGCVMLVKLWQFDLKDRTHVQLNSNFMQSIPHRNNQHTSVIPLYKDQYEETSIQEWRANSLIQLQASKGIEVFVIDGSFCEGGDTLLAHSWLRLPTGSTLKIKTGSNGAKVWVKQNHLEYVSKQIEQLIGIK